MQTGMCPNAAALLAGWCWNNELTRSFHLDLPRDRVVLADTPYLGELKAPLQPAKLATVGRIAQARGVAPRRTPIRAGRDYGDRAHAASRRLGERLDPRCQRAVGNVRRDPEHDGGRARSS